ncbi:MAG: hypothetical protein EVB08_08750 [Synechococcus sp. MED-G135]|nr:MAG: hypothetical protein EVB08_08750 [Synechococcus sp. MED-G135]
MFSLKGSLMLGATACTLALCLPTEAKAHAIESSLRYLNGNLELRSTYSSGDPVNGAVVRFMKADGSAGAELGRIDASGQLRLILPTLDQDNSDLQTVDLQVDGGPGHRDYLALPIRNGEVQIDAISQTEPSSALLLAALGGVGFFSTTTLLGRVRRSRIG